MPILKKIRIGHKYYPYKNRAFFGITRRVNLLNQLIQTKPITLPAKDLKQILTIEKKLAAKLDQIATLTPLLLYFSPLYFKSTPCALFLAKIKHPHADPGITQIIQKLHNLNQLTAPAITKRIFQMRADLKKLPLNFLIDLFKQAEGYIETYYLEKLTPLIDSKSGKINFKNKQPTKIDLHYLLFEPAKATKKITALFYFKKYLKNLQATTTLNNHCFKSAHSNQLFLGVLNLYLKKVQELIGTNFAYTRSISLMSKFDPTLKLTPHEKKLLQLYPKNHLNLFQVFDHFTHGSLLDYKTHQLSPLLKEYAQTLSKTYKDLTDQTSYGSKNLQMALQKKISAPQAKVYLEELLAAYQQLSSYKVTARDLFREKDAPDHKWQVAVVDGTQTASANSYHKIIKIPRKPINLYYLCATLMGHEIEGHFVQDLNGCLLPLHLCRKIGAPHHQLFIEGGAMMIENHISLNLFNVPKIPTYYYLKAIEKRLAGQDYLACVIAFYHEFIKFDQFKKNLKLTDLSTYSAREKIALIARVQHDLLASSKQKLLISLNRVRRLFRGGLSLLSKEPILGNTKELIYLEQHFLIETLKKYHLEHLAMLGKIDFESLTLMLKYSLLPLNKMTKPRYHTLKLWREMVKKEVG